MILASSQRSAAYHHDHTKPVCEDRDAELICPLGTVIAVTLANYGRFSIQECNPTGDTDLRTDCANTATKEILEKLCSGRKSCRFKVDKYLFNDPCPGTSKYLEASYSCEEGRLDEETTPKRCPPVRKEGFDWPTTLAAHKQTTKCGEERYGEMHWNCQADGQWDQRGPDTTGCWSEWTETRRAQMNEAAGREDFTGIADVVRQVRSDSKRPMVGGDLQKIISLLETVTEKVVDTPESRPIRKQMASLAIEIGQNLNKNRDIWKHWREQQQRSFGSRLMTTVESLTGAAGLGKEESTESYVQPTIKAELSGIRKTDLQTYTQYPSMAVWGRDSVDTVEIPGEALQNEAAEVYYVQWENLGEFMAPPPKTVVREVAGKNGPLKEELRIRKVVSNIVGATILENGRAKPMARLLRPIVLNFHHRQEDLSGMGNAECVFWNGAEEKWDANGCRMEMHNDTMTVCHCDHLTHFAVLMDVRGHQLSDLDEQLLTFITYAGCTLSIFCLLFTFLAFQVFSQGGGDRVFIHKNLCLTLAAAELVFLLGIWQTERRLECSIIAGVLMYLFLTSLTWMLLEGFQLYHMLVEVFPRGSKKVRLFFIGYGAPLLIVGAAWIFDSRGFGNEKHCWLRTNDLFTLWFIVPAALILVSNTAFLVMTLCIVYRHSNGGYTPCKREEDGGRSVRSWVKGAMGVSCLLGVTWAFGLFWVDDGTSTIAAYLFTAFNALQGLFIFLFHVVFSEKMRRDAREWFAKHGCGCGGEPKTSENRQSTPNSGTGTGSDFLYPSTADKYGGIVVAPGYYQHHDVVPVYQYQHHPHHHHPYQTQIHAPMTDYDTISYGDMVAGAQYSMRSPPFVARTLQRGAPQYYSQRNSPHDFRMYYPGYPGPTAPEPTPTRPPPEFSPPPPPGQIPRNLAAAAAAQQCGTTSAGVTVGRRPPSSKASDDSAYSEQPFHSSRYDSDRVSVLTQEVIPNGSTVLRIDMSRNPPILAHEV
ncbi:unnamed protein product, partial [Mesorhabditis spiculigera]